MYEIRDDRLFIDNKPCRFVPTEHVGGRIEPTLILIHDTASRLEIGGVLSWFKRNPQKVAAHFVIGIDGETVQMADCDRKLNHAGESTFKGRRYCNGYAVGIELMSPGKLTGRSSTEAVSWFGQVFQVGTLTYHDGPKHGGKGWWLPYDRRQLVAVENLVRALASGYSTITDVAGHFEVSPGRKVDPGPHFPLETMRKIVSSRSSPSVADITPHQKRLVDLGYHLGATDGQMGPRTRSAIRDFQEQNRLMMTGHLDARTLYALHDEAAKPFPIGYREEMAERGDIPQGETLAGSVVAKRGSEGAGTLEVMSAVSKPLEDGKSLIDKVTEARSVGDGMSSLLDWAMSSTGLKTIVVLGLCACVWYGAHRAAWARIKDFALGKNVGR